MHRVQLQHVRTHMVKSGALHLHALLKSHGKNNSDYQQKFIFKSELLL